MVLSLSLLLMLVAPPAPPVDARPAPPRPGLSWTESDALGRKLEAIEHRKTGARPETVPVSQAELNSYLNLELGPRLPRGLSGLDVRLLGPDLLEATATLDLDQVRDHLPPTRGFNPVLLLSGRVPVELKLRLTSDGGFGSLDFEEIRLGGYQLPVSLLQQLVLSSTRTADNPEGFDLLAPFRLPYAVKRVRLQPGRALLEL